MQTLANYVKGKGFTLHQSHYFVYVVASASREHISVQKKTILMHRVAINAKDGSIKHVHSTTRKQMWTAMLSIYVLYAA